MYVSRSPRASGLVFLMALALGVSISCAGRTPVNAPAADVTQLQPLALQPYRLQVGDEISVMFWGNTDLDQQVTIRPDGLISLPFVDEVQAAGLTPSELDAELTDRYTGELARPEITIIVRTVPSQRVFVGGEVAAPGAYALVGTTTLSQVIHEAGGFLPSARRKEVLLVRTLASGERFARSIDVRPVWSGQDPNADFPLQAFDVVFVPRTKITNVALFVDQYINDVVPGFFWAPFYYYLDDDRDRNR